MFFPPSLHNQLAARVKHLAEQVKTDAATGATSLPKPEWKGWTLSQEMAAFDGDKSEDEQLLD